MNEKFKLKKKIPNGLAGGNIPVGTEGFITRHPDEKFPTFGVRICGIDLEVDPQHVEVVGGAS
ncbi:MAG: hypothetical protein AAGC78_10390 [Cellvibrio sp.]|uniref:hypothetical protein n=1 Tax=Cellvibrio sp. TaxID=1965322 RepID=UPI0031ADC7EB